MQTKMSQKIVQNRSNETVQLRRKVRKGKKNIVNNTGSEEDEEGRKKCQFSTITISFDL